MLNLDYLKNPNSWLFLVRPSASTVMTFFENEVLELTEKLIPLQSAHTQSGKDGAGAPEKNVDELSDTGLKTRDTNGNDNKAK
jgi:hypothetical protein